MKPTGRRVILEPFYETLSYTGLHLKQSRYPVGGWVVAVGPQVREDLQPEDFVLLENHDFEIPMSLVDSFLVIVKDEDGRFDSVRVKMETFRQLQATKERYDHTREDGFIRVFDIDSGQGAKFLASNIDRFEWGVETTGTTPLEYTNVQPLEDGLVLVDVNTILCKITADKGKNNGN